MEQQTTNKTNIWKTISMIAIILILLGIAFFVLNYGADKNYKKGYAYGLQQGQLSVIQSISQTGNIPYLDYSTGNMTIKSISISKLCSNMQGAGK
jgi:hypothetical protein